METVVAAARRAFLTRGYAGTSVDDLLAATGLHRSSLYATFGSKRGLFDAVLDRLGPATGWDADALDLVLVALMDLAPHDEPVRSRLTAALAALPDATAVLGHRLLDRAGTSTPSAASTPSTEEER